MNDRAGITSTSNTSYEEIKQTALKRDYRHPSRVICTVSNEEIGQHFL
jgi:hypothetical protein